MIGGNMSDDEAMDLAWALPRDVAYWAAIRVGAYATQGKWGNESPTDLLFMDALKRWERQEEPEKLDGDTEVDSKDSGSGKSTADA